MPKMMPNTKRKVNDRQNFTVILTICKEKIKIDINRGLKGCYIHYLYYSFYTLISNAYGLLCSFMHCLVILAHYHVLLMHFLPTHCLVFPMHFFALHRSQVNCKKIFSLLLMAVNSNRITTQHSWSKMTKYVGINTKQRNVLLSVQCNYHSGTKCKECQ